MTLTFDGAARSVLGDFGLLVGIVVENTTTRKSHGAQLPLAVDLSVRPGAAALLRSSLDDVLDALRIISTTSPRTAQPSAQR